VRSDSNLPLGRTPIIDRRDFFPFQQNQMNATSIKGNKEHHSTHISLRKDKGNSTYHIFFINLFDKKKG
jgi:hypothetical protein